MAHLCRKGMGKTLKNLIGILYGLAYGVSLIVPGLSGGTLLVIFGCYDKVCGALSLDFKLIKQHIMFFIPFGIGAVAGLLGAVLAIADLLKNYPVPTNIFFGVLILAALPFIVKTAFKDERFTLKCIIPLVLGFALVVSASFLGGNGVTDNVVVLALCCAFAAFAMLLPGISGALMLKAFGVYETLITALSQFDFAVIVPAVIGILAGLVLAAKLITFLLAKFKLVTYCAIIGMVAGSIVEIAQNITA